MVSRVDVAVSGMSGSGKSRIALEIELALKALGVKVSWKSLQDQREAHGEAYSESHGLWQPDLPEVTIREINIPIAKDSAP